VLRACWNYIRKLAAIHFGEYVQKDMIRVRVSKDHRAAIVEMSFYTNLRAVSSCWLYPCRQG
jgi:hypothetical protein